jgi:hypothetical protein
METPHFRMQKKKKKPSKPKHSKSLVEMTGEQA